MGSVRIEGQDESHSSEKLLIDCVAVNNALIPRKQRSAIKKRRRVPIVLPWLFPRKKRRVSRKKPKFIMKKQEEISKDEEEVVETLNSLAQMFFDPDKTKKPKLDEGPSNIKPSIEGSAILNVQEESVIQYGKYRYTKEDKGKGLLVSPSLSATEFLSSEMQGSIVRSSAFPNWPENASSVVEHSFFLDKIHYPQNVLEPKKMWNRCSGHVCIAHLIKRTEMLKGLTPRPTQLSINDEQTSLTLPSLKGADFLSLGGRGFHVDTSEGIIRGGSSLEALKQFHRSYQNLRGHPTTLASYTFQGRTSAEAALQAKLSNSMEQQRWSAAHGGVAIPHLPEWQSWGRDSASFFNDAQARFPRLNYQLSPPQLPHMPWVNSSWSLPNTRIQHHRLNPAFEKDQGVLHI
ncbi:hypothetical protein ACS0TY_036567 [Phlomoides rotata]